MLSFLIFLICISVLIIVHEFGHFIAAKRAGIKVEIFSLGFGLKLLGIKRGDTAYKLCAIPLGGYVKMAGDSRTECKGKSYEYLSASPGRRAKILVSGVTLNYLLGLICLCAALVLGIPDSSATIGKVLEGYPAETVGILPGDKITTIDGKEIEFWLELVDIIQDKKGAKANISLIRNGEVVELEVPTKLEDIDTPEGKHKISLIGVQQGHLKYSVKDAFIKGIEEYSKLTTFYYKILGSMLVGKKSLKSMTGFIGIYKITTIAARRGLGPLLYVLAVINLAVAIFNLLPFPVLDGGHLVLLAIEKIRGKALRANIEESIHRVGFTLLILLVAFVTYNDFIMFKIWDNISEWFRSFGK